MKNTKIKSLFFLFASAIFIIAATGCGNLLQSLAPQKEPESPSGNGTLSISIDSINNSDLARTVNPTADTSGLSNITLKGSLAGGEVQSLATWTDCNSLTALSLVPGNWSFTLTATLNGCEFSGTQTATIQSGQNTELSFSLAATITYGGIDFTLNYTYTDGKAPTFIQTQLTDMSDNPVGDPLNINPDGSTNSVQFTRDISNQAPSGGRIASGTYRLTISFYAGENAASIEANRMLLNRYKTIINVADGLVSTDTQTIALNELFTITYSDPLAASGSTLAAGQTKPLNYSIMNSVTLPDMEKEGCTFAGWYAQSDFSGTQVTTTSSFSGDQTFYAKWTCTVTFDLKSGTSQGGTDEQKLVYNQTVTTEPTKPTRSGKVFCGWYTDSACTNAFTFGESGTGTPITADTTLYAKWNDPTLFVNASSGDDTKDGFSYPTTALRTLSAALEKIQSYSTALNWTIKIDGELLYQQSIPETFTTASATTLTLQGFNGNNTQDILNGSSGGSTLKVQSEVPVTVKDLKITGGSAANGGGIYIDTGASVTLTGCTLVTGNTASTNGSGVYVGGTFKMGGSATVAEDNDVYLVNGKSIVITEAFDNSVTHAATIKPSVEGYTEETIVIKLEENPPEGLTLSDVYTKFTVTPNGTTTWHVISTGKLFDGFVEVAGTTRTFETTLSDSKVFVAGRTISIGNLFVCDHEVTQGEYETYCRYANSYSPSSPEGLGDSYPVYKVNIYDAIVYCNLRSMAENLDPVYYMGNDQNTTDPKNWTDIVKDNDDNPTKFCGPSENLTYWNAIKMVGSDPDNNVVTTANGYRLPTEAEWEYIARGGSKFSEDEYCGANNQNNLGDYAWYNTGSVQAPTTVKSKLPNQLGIYDLIGNVQEWCWDWTNGVTSAVASTTPITGIESGAYRIRRSTDFNTYAGESKVSHRDSADSYYRRPYPYDGFRVVRNVQ